MTGALLGLRAKLWWRRADKARLSFSLLALLLGASFSASLAMLVWGGSGELRVKPAMLAARGGPLAVFATWLTMVLVGRVWFALISLGQASPLFDLRRFRVYPVSPRLLSAINFAALFFEPTWLILYPPIAVIAFAIARLPSAPSALALLFSELFAIFSIGGILHLGASVGAAFDARPVLRRGFSIVLLFAGFAVFWLSIADPKRPGLPGLFAEHRWRAIAWTPPGWTALLAQAIHERLFWHALTPALLLALLGLLCAVAAHQISSRDLLRPPEQVQAARASSNGWLLPLVPQTFSALLEKEAKSALRMGWLQFVLVPVAYLLLVRMVFTGPEPLLIAAVYAHLGVLELSTNAFGRDTSAARGYFLWPVRLRELLAAKNAVAYVFSLGIFALLALVAVLSAHVTPGQLAVGLIAHAATFPLLAGVGNAASVFAAAPVRSGRMRRVRGAGPISARLFAMALLAGAAWAPWAVAQLLHLHLYVTYLAELFAMAAVYAGSLGAGAAFLEARREVLLAALAKDE